jgi:superfamily II DNA or RNA helicase/diadenosine tetraphosphate (Ap4A) HIT family hydrolase/HKD family nuclease
VFFRGALVYGLWDAFPVSPGHALLVPHRHIATWFDASDAERGELLAAVEEARRAIEQTHAPDGYNIGINVGEAAGQTIFHLHVHVIPRYRGDVEEPRGGVRGIIPGKASYPVGQVAEALSEYRVESQPPGAALARPPHLRALVTGGDDPLLPHLRAHLAAARGLDVAVAFVLTRGLLHLEEHLRDLVRRGGHVRFLTGDYRDVTEPEALLRLLDLETLASEGQVELRVFESRETTFHPKAYIVHLRGGDGVAFVGSSNVSEPALGSGIEWNYRVVPGRDRAGFAVAVEAFEALFRDRRTRQLTAAWVDTYRRRRPLVPPGPLADVAPEPLAPVTPHAVQQEALEALARTRAEGNAAGLVVLATGLGKTWLAAFDSAGAEYRRVLFVAHREEILDQALQTFRRVRADARLGLYTGQERDSEADVLFASVQTLGRLRHLGQFAPDAFDYIVIDEFHHAAAATYRRIIDHFTPRFLLGLTATPERTDGGDLLALCDENLVYRCDLVDGIRRGLLVPFHYFGVPDEVDYRNIPWRSSRFDEEALTRAVATTARAGNALEQWRRRAGQRTLAFCCSMRHADFMAGFFREAGLRAVAVHSGADSAPRAVSLEQLQEGSLDVVFAVDMFNEGVDLPNVDTIMMLRPTESRVLWLQQFGRGLRKAEAKPHVTVIDYIGNHRTFLIKPRTLLALPEGDAAVAQALERAAAGTLTELPPGCEVTYDLQAVEILRGLLRTGPRVLEPWYTDFRERHGTRPLAVEAFHEGYAPRAARRSDGSWLRLVHRMGDLDEAQVALLTSQAPVPGQASAARFLDELETTPMTRSYKMLVLLAMLNEDRLPGAIDAADLARAVARLAQRSARLQTDLGVPLADLVAVRAHLETNPIRAWLGGAGTGGVAYFTYDDGRFATRFDVPAEQRPGFQSLARELVEWRLAEYLARTPDAAPASGIVCKVSHAAGRPILFLPDRRSHPSIPTGTVPVLIDGEAYEAEFVKVAVNVVRRSGADRNELPALLRGWFGPDAGLPGTNFTVVFEQTDGGWTLAPVQRPSSATDGPEPWRQYVRERIPGLFGLTFNTSVWNQGFVFKNEQIFLLVTLDKSAAAAEHQYQDRFLSDDRFQWQSQNRQHRGGAVEQKMARHVELGIPVHLFVRRTAKVDGRATPFLYCGTCEFVDWEGDRPITVRWRLAAPIPERWREPLAVPTGQP